jgi:hypothetical protein
MEHLFFVPDFDNPSETVFAYRNDTLSTDWTEYATLLDHIPPVTPWLGFAHNDMPITLVLDDYPEAAGWNINSLWNGHLREAHCNLKELDGRTIANEAASFIQSWLYYGTLEAVVGKKIQVSYMMRPNKHGQEVIYSRNLHFCLQAKVFEIRLASTHQRQQTHHAILDQLQLVQRWVSRMVAWSVDKFRSDLNQSYPGFMEHVSRFTPGIVRMVEAIVEMTIYVLRDSPTDGIEKLHVPTDVVDERRKRMKLAGWCDFQIRLLEDTTNQSTIDWFEVKNIHQNPEGHEGCNPSECVRNNIDASTYKQIHCSDSCQCLPLIPNLARIIETLEDEDEDEKIPVVRLEYYPDGTPRLVVSAISVGTSGDYVAISHVWVDGIGGSPEKGLLYCQVLRLATLSARALGRPNIPTNFWVDSLCIPRSKKETYYKALFRIRDVYMCASTVLVVDKLIQTCDQSASTEVIYAHIYISAWMQRMWTYEEAVLAKELLFVLKNDGIYTFDVTSGPEKRRTVSVVWDALGSQLVRLRLNSSGVTIGHISRAFRWRLTNARHEEFMSVSSTLGLDTASLEEVRGDERTKKFWLMLKTIPADVPFLDGPKLPMKGFQWAPQTLMFPSQTEMDTNPDGNKSICTTKGLVGRYILASLSEPLQGCNKGPDSIFLVILEKHEAWPNTGKTALRIYCTESWPCPPQAWAFDAVVFSIPARTIPAEGKWLPGVALLREGSSNSSSHQGSKTDSRLPDYAFVRRVLVERLRYEEVVQSRATVMYSGADRTIVDAGGEWIIDEICIT